MGLQDTQAPFIAWSHADEQCEPYDAFRGFEILRHQPVPLGVVKGTRLGRDKKNAAVTHVFEFLARLILGLNIKEINAQPKVFHRQLLNTFSNPPKTFAFDLYGLFMASKHGYRIESFPVSFPNRVHGLSKWSSTILSRSKTIFGMILFMIKLAFQEGRLCGK